MSAALSFVILAPAVDELFDDFTSVLSARFVWKVAVLLIVVPFVLVFACATMVIVAVAFLARVGIVQFGEDHVPADTVTAGAGVVFKEPVGIVSWITTLFAVSGPLFLTVILQVKLLLV